MPNFGVTASAGFRKANMRRTDFERFCRNSTVTKPRTRHGSRTQSREEEMKSGHLATCVLVAVLALTSCSKRPAQDADTKIASVQSIIIDAYRTISLVETEFGADVDSLVSSNKTLPWDAQVSLAQRLEILCQIRGCDLPGWKDVDPWGSRLNFQQNNHVDERRAAPGDI